MSKGKAIIGKKQNYIFFGEKLSITSDVFDKSKNICYYIAEGEGKKEEMFTIGIEEEFQLIDPKTLELKSHIAQVLKVGQPIFGVQMKPELHQSIVEINTPICKSIKEARNQVLSLRGALFNLARENGFLIAAAGTHPFSHWKDQLIVDDPRYGMIIDEMQVLARSLLIFGLHIHIGVEDNDVAIKLMNLLRNYIPYLTALTVNSPFWMGRETGIKSYRIKIFEKFPRTGIPEPFAGWEDFHEFLNTLICTNCIDNIKKIWWDIRPHIIYKTLEFRVCDVQMKAAQTIAIAALAQALVYKLYNLYREGYYGNIVRNALILENKWRAVRYGLDGNFVDFRTKKEVPIRDSIYMLLEFLIDAFKDLDSLREYEYIKEWLKKGTGADAQLKVFKESNDLYSVSSFLVKETMEE